MKKARLWIALGGLALITTGIAMVSVPAALVTLGLALYVDAVFLRR